MRSRQVLFPCALVFAIAGAAQATTVKVTNASSGWTVSRFTSTSTSGAYNSVSYAADPTISNFAVVEVNPIHPLWTAQNDPRLAGANAKWVSSNVASGTGSLDPKYTKYIYNSSFNVSQTSALGLTFAADNFVDTLILSTGANGTGTILDTWTNTEAFLGDPWTNGAGKVWGFTLGNVQNKLTNGTGTIYITANTYNFDTQQAGDYFPGPNGFIMAVDAVPAVPLPAAAWGGLSLLGTLGIARRFKKCRA